MTKAQNIKAILECNFAGFKEEIIDIAVSCIMSLDQEPCNKRGDYIYPTDIVLETPNTATSMPCEDAIKKADIKVLDEVIKSMKWTPKQRTGHWIESAINQIKGCDDIGHFYVCTECGRYINLKQGEKLSDYPYCHCGAKMESEEQA